MATSTLRTESAAEGIGHGAIGDTLRPAGGPSWRGGWTALAVSAICRGALAMVASLLLWAVLPAAFGWPVTVVMSGSMEPLLRPGDIVASRPISADAVRPGQILLVNDPDHAGRLRLHRLAIIRPDGTLTLRGDANAADDSTPVRRSAVHAVGSLKVPAIGLPIYWARTHQIGPLAASAAALGLLIGGAWLRRDRESDPDDQDVDGDSGPGDGTGAEVGTVVPPVPPTRQSDVRRVAFTGRNVRVAGISVLTFALVGAGIASGPGAFATPFGAATSNSNTWTAASAFSGCASAAMTNNPYAYFPLTETSGTTASDTSGNGHDATYGTGVTHTSGGGPCSDTPAVASFNGSAMISTTQPITLGASFTEQIWFNTSYSHGESLIGFAGTPTGSVSDPQLYLNDPSLLVFEVRTPNGTKTISSSSKVNTGGWHLATATLSSAGMKLYLDGQLVASDSTVTTMTTSAGYLQMGNGFTGSLSGGALFGTALSAAQVLAGYQARA